jgi:riboflavin kinase/FMN adenylyltransferase
MRLVSGFDAHAGYRGGFVSIGNFDGVHRGHQTMLKTLCARAHAASAPAVVLTFDPHPSVLLRPEAAPPVLTTLPERTELLGRYGVDYVVAVPVDQTFLQLTAEQFFRQIVIEQLAARGLVEGPNFFFGHHRTGNVTVLKHFCTSAGLTLDVIPPVTVDEQLVSSSVIRSLLQDGDLDDAVELLGHSYRLTGTIGQGEQRGRLLGFPTANLTQVATVVPGHGVYGGTVTIDTRTYLAAINIGANPTFAEDTAKIEIHLLDFQGDLYGKPLGVDLKFRLREVQKFASVEALRSQLEKDVLEVRRRG